MNIRSNDDQSKNKQHNSVKAIKLFSDYRFLSVCCLLFCLLISTSLQAKTLVLPLSKVTRAEAVNLRCTSSEYELMLPISPRWKINRAMLKFSYFNSAALIKRNSQLEVSLNGIPLTQIKLDPLAPQGNAAVELPNMLLESSYNSLKFNVAQHYASECELPCMPELWTKVLANEAILELDYELKPVPLRISAVSDFLFDAKIFPEAEVNVLTETTQSNVLTFASIVASGIALRYDYRKTRFHNSDKLIQGMDNVIVGNKEYIESFMANYGVKINVEGPLLKIYHLPRKTTIIEVDDDGNNIEKEVIRWNDRQALLVIAGRNDKELRLAAETIDILSIPFPESPDMQISAFSMPEISLYSGKQMLTTDRQYKFKKLNFTTRSFRGINAAPSSFEFRVPTDFKVKPNQYVTLKLDFSYAASLRQDSSLSILLNGDHVGSLHLDNEKGALITGYEIKFPTHLFQGGINLLAFDVTLTPSITEHCSFIQAENLFLTLFDSSSLLFPSMPHRVEMPNIELLFVNGFPYTRWPDGYKSRIYLGENNRVNATAALNLVGMITQKNGFPLFGLELSDQIPENYDGEILALGKVADIDPILLNNAPLVLGEINQVPYPAFESWEARKALAFSSQKSEMGLDQGMITQFESPYKQGRTVTLFTAPSDSGMAHLTQAILAHQVQSVAKGDLVLVDYVFNENLFERFGEGKDYRVTALSAGKTYMTGKGGKISKLDYYLSSYPWIYWAALGLCIAILTLASYLLLKRHKNKRLPESQ